MTRVLTVSISDELYNKIFKGDETRKSEKVQTILWNGLGKELSLIQHLKRALALAENYKYLETNSAEIVSDFVDNKISTKELRATKKELEQQPEHIEITGEVQEIFNIFKEQHELDIDEDITDNEIINVIKNNIDDLNSVKVPKAELEECENNEETKLVVAGKKAEYLYRNYFAL